MAFYEILHESLWNMNDCTNSWRALDARRVASELRTVVVESISVFLDEKSPFLVDI